MIHTRITLNSQKCTFEHVFIAMFSLKRMIEALVTIEENG